MPFPEIFLPAVKKKKASKKERLKQCLKIQKVLESHLHIIYKFHYIGKFSGV